MFVVTGVTGKVGAIVADTLLAADLPVRAVVRSEEKATEWRARGCDIAVVPDAADREALTAAFAAASAIFLMNPPNYDSEPGFPDGHAAATATVHAIGKATPGKLVLLSTIGAQASEFNLLNRSAIFETALRNVSIPVAFLRAAWFMENAAWDVAAAFEGQIKSYLQPLDRRIEMVSVRDIGRTAADLMREDWTGSRLIELSGPSQYSPEDEAAAFSAALNRPVEVVAVPRETWERQFRDEGMLHPEARMRMLDGFNEGWIDFQHIGAERRVGTVTLHALLSEAIGASNTR
jgi:uncharacterized protein YbjT (DUF2867 family)